MSQAASGTTGKQPIALPALLRRAIHNSIVQTFYRGFVLSVTDNAELNPDQQIRENIVRAGTISSPLSCWSDAVNNRPRGRCRTLPADSRRESLDERAQMMRQRSLFDASKLDP
jgi:hypothetical protein